jgi:cytoskeletal protein RodZ
VSDVRRIQWLIVGAIVLGIGVCWADNHFASGHGADSEKLKQAVGETKAGERQLTKAETVYVHRVDTLRRQVTKLEQLRDTLRITDTVQVKEFIQRADSTVRACFAVVQSCEQKDSAHKVIEAGLRKQNEALKALIPGRTEKIITAVKWLTAGTVVGLAVSHR